MARTVALFVACCISPWNTCIARRTAHFHRRLHLAVETQPLVVTAPLFWFGFATKLTCGDKK